MLKLLSKLIKPKPPRFYKRGSELPKCWGDVSIKELQELNYILDRFELDKNWFRRNIKTVELLAPNTKKNTVGEIANAIHKMEFLETPLPDSFPPKFYLNDKLYICHANIKQATAWQAISISNYAEMNATKNMHYIAACLIWEANEKSPETTIEERAQYFLNNLPASVLHGLCAFFLHNSAVSLIATRNYLGAKIQKMEKKKVKTGFYKNGGGKQQ